jgi:hypothetical protein
MPFSQIEIGKKCYETVFSSKRFASGMCISYTFQNGPRIFTSDGKEVECHGCIHWQQSTQFSPAVVAAGRVLEGIVYIQSLHRKIRGASQQFPDCWYGALTRYNATVYHRVPLS